MAHVGHERVERVLNHLLCMQGTEPGILITQRELAAALGLSQPVISHALRMLRDTGRLRRNVDRSWSVSRTPVYDSDDKMERRIAVGLQLQETKIDALITLVGQLQEKIDSPGKIVQAAWSQAAWSQAAETRRLQPAATEVQRRPAENENHVSSLFYEIPTPTGELHIWHERDNTYPAGWQNFHADAFGYDSTGLVFAMQLRHSGQPLPMLASMVPDPDSPQLLRKLGKDTDLRWCQEISTADLLRALREALKHGLTESNLIYVKTGRWQ